ncbi:MAG: D-lyxose/D-mannose family sugar isomerase [Candidatus Lokiarchaeota archaeon]|nr:D-lyxose/D-mannose family sugar isomerase [Candidatus Lokiarchaeota archaeon]
MKRSKINDVMRQAVDFFEEQRFFLPEFAFWKLEDWRSRGEEIKEIIDNQLGWDITDYGSGNFSDFGLIHFTLRNGNFADIPKGAKPYCEKVMIMEEGQVIPMHHHNQKIEDIINRGGGILSIQLYNTTIDNKLAETPVVVFCDGIKKELESGSVVNLKPGDSITIEPEHYHKFWCKEGSGRILIGEVSSVNDDYRDNVFLKEIERFTKIEEDEDPLYLLYDDYGKFLELNK